MTAARAKPLSQIIGPLKLDRLTVTHDDGFLETMDGEQNLPAGMASALRELY